MSEQGYQEALRRISACVEEGADDLDLNRLDLVEIPPEVWLLSNLEKLSLSDNRLATVPAELGGLVNLRGLFLCGNQLAVIPAELGQLANLEELYLYDNQLVAVPAELGQLANLRTLSLYNNQLAAIPAELGQLTNLQNLYLDKNRLVAIPGELEQLARLQTLDLSHNQLVNLPDSLRRLDVLTELYLHENPALGLPTELLGPTYYEVFNKQSSPVAPLEILEYYSRGKGNGRPLNEAKLILVGNGAVGKSSLVEKLIHGTFVPGKAKTEGINIERWELAIGGDPIRLNVWDFGGQEIMHATHQFFLTERSLYLLVLNGREGKEDLEAEYWLKLIASFGAASPVIVVLNKIREHAFDLNRSALLKKYPNIKGFVRTECSDDTGIEELKTLISKETDTLDELRVKFPGEWFAVKDLLATTKDNYLSFDQYRDLCREHEITIPRHQEMLAKYLNQLGIVLNYRDDPRLKDTHVLSPHWVTNGIYKILNSPLLEGNQGEIELNDIAGILPPSDYPTHMCRFIFDLMKKFDLCFSYPGDECHYLIPELLPKNEPGEVSEFNLGECLNFQYQYPVLPEGLLPRFITRTYHLSLNEPHWRSGTILNFENARALVKADATDRRVFISVTGDSAESRRRLLAVIRSDFERIHRDIKNLNPLEHIPLPGLPDETVPYQDLVVMEQKGMKEFPKVIGADIKTYQVSDLLSGVDLTRRE
jgi:internalin A